MDTSESRKSKKIWYVHFKSHKSLDQSLKFIIPDVHRVLISN